MILWITRQQFFTQRELKDIEQFFTHNKTTIHKDTEQYCNTGYKTALHKDTV